MKLCLGVGPKPIHPQHLEIMKDLSEWTLVDKYVIEPDIKQWDAEVLGEVPDNSIETIYASHLLEHFEHTKSKEILSNWYRKLKTGGELIINVPDLEWLCKQVLKYEQGFLLDGYYNQFHGEHGLLSVVYGSQSHEGEYHKAGFTNSYLVGLLRLVGFESIDISRDFDAHDMQVLIARCRK